MRYTVKNIKELSSINPRKYPKPSEKYLKKVRMGAVVKLILELDYEKKFSKKVKCDYYVLVNVISCRDNEIRGIINYCDQDKMLIGENIKFTYENILFVYADKNKVVSTIEYANISQRALENKEINWVFKSTPLDEKDSGWQLFYGDEDSEYILDSSNIQRISMEEVLRNEPLLEYVFSKKIDNAEYSSRVNKFLVI